MQETKNATPASRPGVGGRAANESKTVQFKPWAEGLAAAKANLLPGLVLQVFALLVVLGYYFVPAFSQALDGLGRLKTQSGIWFGLGATAVFGGLIPFLYLKFSKTNAASTPWNYFPFFLVFWAYRGVEVDLFYRLQALMFGSNADFWTIVKKVLVDQLVYNVLWAGPLQILAYHWLHNRYRFSVFRAYDWKEFFKRRLPVTLISTWGVWVPMVSIIYSLPSNLQIPLFNIVLCFWVLIVSTITRRKAL